MQRNEYAAYRPEWFRIKGGKRPLDATNNTSFFNDLMLDFAWRLYSRLLDSRKRPTMLNSTRFAEKLLASPARVDREKNQKSFHH